MKNNVGLDIKIDLEFVVKNPTPQWKWLKENTFNEVFVSSREGKLETT